MQNIKESTKAPLVSVIIATFNMGQYIAGAVKSILQQSIDNLEVIVVDDGSTDQTHEAVSALQDTRVRYFYQTNQGQTWAKNLGLSHAQGAYIAFCDADDLWEPNKLATQLLQFDNPTVGVVYSEIAFLDEKGNRSDNLHHEVRHSGDVTQALLIENFVPFGTAIFRRECYERLGGFNTDYRMGIDWDLWLRYSLEYSFFYCPEATYLYRIWPGQMSNNYRGRYTHARKILENFSRTNKNRIKSRWVRDAWADMNIKEANILWRREGTLKEPFILYIKGIFLAPSKLSAWKSFIKFIMRKK